MGKTKTKKAVIFGAGKNYNKLKKHIPQFFDVDIIAITDNSESLHGSFVDGFKVIPPKELCKGADYDLIIVTPKNSGGIVSQLINIGILPEKIEQIPQDLQFSADIAEFIEFKDKNVLEIGCGTGSLLKVIAELYNPKCITGIDLMLSEWWGIGESEGDNWCIKDGNAEALEFDDNSFDAIFSIATFEHITDVSKALSEIKRVLKPSGRFYTLTVPLWTSVIGHHFCGEGDNTWNPYHLSLIPPWGHLYMSENEMKDELRTQNTEEKLINEMIEFIYHSKIVNRTPRCELLKSIVESGMIIRSLNEEVGFNRNDCLPHNPNNKSELTEEILRNIKKTDYRFSDLGVLGFTAVLEKPVTI